MNTKRSASRFQLGLLLLCLLISSASFAHPMGNFSTSHYSGIRVERDSVEIHYLIDLAEIPTFQEIQQYGLVAQPADAGTIKYVEKEGEILRAGLLLTLNGHPLTLRTESANVIFPPGAGGLPTMKMAFVYRAPIVRSGPASDDPSALSYSDGNFPSRVGWKEIVATAGPGVAILNTSVPAKDRSSQLSDYPTDLLNSPPLDLEATMSLRWDETPSGLSRTTPPSASQPVNQNPIQAASAQRDTASLQPVKVQAVQANGKRTPDAISPRSEPSLQANKQSTPQNRFTELMTTKKFGFWFLIGAAAIAATLGAMHALEPGHGKTIVAAYLVGSKGTPYHAFLLGLIVTVSHTASVYTLGAITLYASRYIVPAQLYPWLGAISGMLIAALGSYLFLQRYAGHEVGHSHGPGGHHHHGLVDPGHTDDGHVHADGVNDHSGLTHDEIRADVPYRQLLALGITGGIVPCPAALVVLLSAVALNRVWFGLFLIVAFSFGLAAVLIAVGILMVYARSFMNRFRSEGRLFTRWLPLASAAVIMVLGMAIAFRSLVTGGILQIRL